VVQIESQHDADLIALIVEQALHLFNSRKGEVVLQTPTKRENWFSEMPLITI
jgi:hypothetical protein